MIRYPMFKVKIGIKFNKWHLEKAMRKIRNIIKNSTLILFVAAAVSIIWSFSAFAADSNACVSETGCGGIYENGVCTANKDHFQPAHLNQRGEYEISNAGQLFWLDRENDNGSISVKLLCDIDLYGYEWIPISYDGGFEGVFDGGYHVIKNMTVSQASDSGAGFFQLIGDGAKVYAVGFENASVTNAGAGYTGILAGTAGQNNEISDCYTVGTVSGAELKTAGLIGSVGLKSTVSNCYTSCVVAIASLQGEINSVYCGSDKSIREFASGEVAYLLNMDRTNIRWYQKLGTEGDAYPHFNPMDDNVVNVSCDGVSVIYTNTVESPSHNLTYLADGDVIIERCLAERCQHSATASLNLIMNLNEIIYTGKEILPYETAYSGDFYGELPRISYDNNINAGSATVKFSVAGQTITRVFEIRQRSFAFSFPIQHLTSGESVDDSLYTVDGLLEGHKISYLKMNVNADGQFTAEYKISDSEDNAVTDNYCLLTSNVGYFHEYDKASYASSDDCHWNICGKADCDVKINLANCSGGSANCTQKAVCEICGGEYGDIDINAHHWNLSEVLIHPTCTENGENLFTCAHSSTHTKTEIAHAHGHKYDNACDSDCNVCASVRASAEHTDENKNGICDECGVKISGSGLSVGAIVGIAVGAAVAAGVGAFAIFWFAVKKRSFKDLIKVFKV